MTSAHLITSLGWTLLHFVWQGAVVGCVTAVLLAALRNARPEQRYALACGALLACLAWPLADLAQLLAAGPAHGGRVWAAQAGTGLTLAGRALSLQAWLGQHIAPIVTAWAACAALLALRVAFGLAWVERMRRGQPTDPAWQARLSLLARRFGLTREIRLRIVDGIPSPVTAGWWRPVVLVPASLLSGMAPDLLEALLAHELAHVSRRDYLVNLVQNLIETLLFYHPVVWWISRRIRTERELVADGLAARRLGEPRQLALALFELEKLQFRQGNLVLAASGGDLAARIRRLLRPDTRAVQWQAALPILALAIACIANAHVARPTAPRMVPANGRAPAIVDFSSCNRPEYPKADLRAGIQGKVTLLFHVNVDGTLAETKLQRSSGHASLDEAARNALAKCRFAPALRDGRPVESWQPVQYVWTLE